MFAKATSNFIKEIDPDGSLIPVSRLNNSDKLVPMSLVVKRQRFWVWQKPKYLPSDFTLDDVLIGDQGIDPVVVEADFLKYTGTFGDIQSGKLAGGLGPMNVNVEGKGASKLQSSFGSLKKQEVDVHKLLKDSRDRVLNLEHCLIQQTSKKRGEVLGVLKERIVTTQGCSISEKVQEQGGCGGMVGFCGTKTMHVSVNENRNLHKDSEVSLEIPAKTVIAYSIIELEVKADGQFELCLLPDTRGGFEVDSPGSALTMVDGPIKRDLEEGMECAVDAPIDVLLKELTALKTHFQRLTDLPAPTRSTMFLLLKKTMADAAVVAALETTLDTLCWGEVPDPDQLEDLSDQESSLQQTVQALLELLQSDGTSSRPLLLVTHLVVSALGEMSDGGLDLLGNCCSPPVLRALQHLLHSIETGATCDLQDQTVSCLQDKSVYEGAERLFSSSDMVLQRQGDVLTVQLEGQSGPLPFILCVALHCLASLCKE